MKRLMTLIGLALCVMTTATNRSFDIPKTGYANVSFYTEGGRTASGEMFNTNQKPGHYTAAVQRAPGSKKPCLPFGSTVRMTFIPTGKKIVIRVTDTGSYKSPPGRGLWFDLSRSGFIALTGGTKIGRTKKDTVTYEILTLGKSAK